LHDGVDLTLVVSGDVMDQLKPKHYILLVAAVIALVAGVYFSMGGPEPVLTRSVVLVDVSTGQLFEFSTKDYSVVLPGKNPDTGKISLLPVRKDANGKWQISGRYLGELDRLDEKPTAVKDRKTGEVTVSSEAPRFVSDKERGVGS
jgi:hypothetical protein